MELKRPTEKFIRAQIEFHEAGLEWYRLHCQSLLAAWSQQQVDEWRAKLPREAGEGE